MTLELDLGNTRGKWRVLAEDDGEVVARGVGSVADWLDGAMPAEWPARLRRVRVASVLRAEIEQRVAVLLASRVIGDIAFARPAASCGPVRNAYRNPGQLGVDRWLGIVAAYHEFQAPLLVASAGSALTLDLVAGDGRHQGGYIMPGPRLMREVLLSATDRVRFESRDQGHGMEPGFDTGECVHHGVSFAVVAAIDLARRRSRIGVSGPVRLVLTGGYAAVLRQLPELQDAEWRPELVFDGLRWVLP